MAPTQVQTTIVQDEVDSRLHIEVVPGTEILTDIEGVSVVHGGRSNVVLVPHPSPNLDDPLVRGVPCQY